MEFFLYIRRDEIGSCPHEMVVICTMSMDVYFESAEEKESNRELIRKLFWFALGAAGVILLLAKLLKREEE